MHNSVCATRLVYRSGHIFGQRNQVVDGRQIAKRQNTTVSQTFPRSQGISETFRNEFYMQTSPRFL